jgi:hypothetical protein
VTVTVFGNHDDVQTPMMVFTVIGLVYCKVVYALVAIKCVVKKDSTRLGTFYATSIAVLPRKRKGS